jgi:hypothetical protein
LNVQPSTALTVDGGSTVNVVDPNRQRRLPLTVNGVDTKKEGNKELKQEKTKTVQPGLSIPYLQAFEKHWLQKNGIPYSREIGAIKELDRIRREVDLATFEKLCALYFALPDKDKYLAGKSWPLRGLTSWRWNALRIALAGGPEKPKAKTCAHEWVEVNRHEGGTVYRCKACGLTDCR